MKKVLIPVFAAVFSVALWRCTRIDDTPAPGKSVEISTDIAARTTDFAFDLFKKIQATQPAGDNVFVSPLSLHMALGMLLNGAEGETARQIMNTLKTEGVSRQKLNETYQTLLKDLPQADPNVQLGLANSLWYRSTFQVEDDFLNVLRQSFQAEVSALDFTRPEARDKINAWASDKTKGKIKNVIDQIQPNDVLFLMNALYFKGDWKYEFDPAKTSDAPFYLANDGEKTVKMMRINETFQAAQRPEYAAVQLPYASGQFALTLLIPAQNVGVEQVIAGLNATAWQALQTSLQTQKINVGLPRFTLKYDIKLNETLKAMGMPRAFTDAAELAKINPSADLLVSFVKQNTYLGIDEKGTEAAAVTTVGVGVTSVGPDPYVCDRPFVVVISEKTSGTILFMGRIMNP